MKLKGSFWTVFPELHKSLSFHGWDLGAGLCATKARLSLSEAYQASCTLPLLGDSSRSTEGFTVEQVQVL